MTWMTLGEARAAGWISRTLQVDEPWCYWFDTDTRALLFVGRPCSPVSVLDR